MISVVVLTKNEVKNIQACLESVAWADELVVIDDFSKDKTGQIAQKMGARVYRRRLENNFAAQRNFGLKKAKGDWVLFLDADERISPMLSQEIQTAVKKTSAAGFYLRRRDWMWGKELKHGESGQVKLLRLARKGAGEWQRRVHETWQIAGKVEKLKNPIIHYPHPTLNKFLQHLNFHSSLHAKAHQEAGNKPALWRILVMPVGKFCQNYLFRFGFLDGQVGFIVALLMSFHSFLAWSKFDVDY